MSSVNKVIIVGNLGADPEVRSFQNGGKVASMRIATSERWKDRNTGEQKERTEWHTVAIFAEGLVSVAERFLRKGSKVYVEGKLQTRKWTHSDGGDRYSTEIVLQGFDAKLVMLDGAQGAGPGRHDYSGHQDEGRFGGSGGGASSGGQPPAFSDDLNDDVPF